MNFTTEILPYMQLIAVFIVWYFLNEKLKHKESQIETLSLNFNSIKELLSVYKAKDFIEYVDMKIETKELVNKKQIKDLKDKFSSDLSIFNNKVRDITDEMIHERIELGIVAANFVLLIPEKDRDNFLNLKLPLNKEFINEILSGLVSNTKD